MERKNKVRLPLVERLRLQEIEQSPELAPLVIPALDVPAGYKWHPVVRRIKKQFDELSANAVEKKARFDWEEKHPRMSYPHDTPGSYGWTHFAQSGMPMYAQGRGRTAVRVTLRTHQQALKTINAVCFAASGSDFRVSLNDGESSINLSKDGAEVHLRLVEKNHVENTPQGRVMHPTGRLELLISGSGSSSDYVIKDTEDSPIETQMDEVLAQIERRHQLAIAANKKHEIWRQEYAKEQAQRQEEHERKEALKREAEEEAKRRDALVREAEIWQKAESIRRYLAELDARIEKGGVPAPDYEPWKAWASNVADAFDSTRVRRPEAKNVD